MADLAVTGAAQAAPGVSVSVKGSAYDQVTHDTGRFTMIPLPAGRHTLLFRKGTEFALTRSVEVALGPDGQPDGVSLGDVEIPFAASVRGRLVGADSAVGGTMVDETTGLTAPAPGRFQLDVLSLGEHVLKFGMVGVAPGEEWLGGRTDRRPPRAGGGVLGASARRRGRAPGHPEHRARPLPAGLAPPAGRRRRHARHGDRAAARAVASGRHPRPERERLRGARRSGGD